MDIIAGSKFREPHENTFAIHSLTGSTPKGSKKNRTRPAPLPRSDLKTSKMRCNKGSSLWGILCIRQMLKGDDIPKLADTITRMANHEDFACGDARNGLGTVCFEEISLQKKKKKYVRTIDSLGEKRKVPHTWVSKGDDCADRGHGGTEHGGSVVNDLGALRVAAHDNLGVWALGHGFLDGRSPVTQIKTKGNQLSCPLNTYKGIEEGTKKRTYIAALPPGDPPCRYSGTEAG